MIHTYPKYIDGLPVMAVEVHLPKTTLLSVNTATGYIMCGALDVDLLNTKLSQREIIAGRAVGVRTIDQLLAAPLESVTIKAKEMGIVPGTTGSDALRIMLQHENIR